MDKEKNKLTESRKERTDVIIALVVVLFAGAFIFSKIENKSAVSEIEDRFSAQESIFEQENANHFNENTIIKKDSVENQIIHPISKIKKDTTQLKNDLKPHSQLEESIEQKNFQNTSNQEKNTNNHETVIEKESITEYLEEIKEENVVVEVEEKVIETKEQIKYNKKQNIVECEVLLNKPHTDNIFRDCTIIVGVFKESKNRNKVIKKLINLGYKHNEGLMQRGLTYVGVPVTCANKLEIKRLINELNSTFKVNAWLKKN